MPTFILRDMHQEQWDRFVARAKREGWSRGTLIKQLIRDYGNERISVSRPPDPIESYRPKSPKSHTIA